MVKSLSIAIHKREKCNVTGTMNMFSFANIICNNFKSLFKVTNRNTVCTPQYKPKTPILIQFSAITQ